MKNFIKGTLFAGVIIAIFVLLMGGNFDGGKPEVMAEMPEEPTVIIEEQEDVVEETAAPVDVKSTKKAPSGADLGDEYIAPTYESSKPVEKSTKNASENTTEFKNTKKEDTKMNKEVEDAKKDSNKKVETIKEDIVVVTEEKKVAPSEKKEETKKIDTTVKAEEVKSEESKTSKAANNADEKNTTVKKSTEPSVVTDFEALGF